MEKADIKSMTLPKLEAFCAQQGLAKFRAQQAAPKTSGLF